MDKESQIFFDYIKPQSKVMDIGCGEGNFLEQLKNQKNCKTYGVEISSEKVSLCLEKGISAIQGDGDLELEYFPNKEVSPAPFDYIIIANALQVMKHPKKVLEQSRRISKEVLVIIPNFGFFQNRLYLLLKGKMPVTSQLSYQWYETPNIHFSTITDFIILAKDLGFEITKSYYLNKNGKTRRFLTKFPALANIFGTSAAFVMK